MALPPDGKSQPSAIERAQEITKRLQPDESLEKWAARLIAAADEFQRRPPDPLNGFLPTHAR